MAANASFMHSTTSTPSTTSTTEASTTSKFSRPSLLNPSSSPKITFMQVGGYDGTDFLRSASILTVGSRFPKYDVINDYNY